jgi:hypothetical protein
MPFHNTGMNARKLSRCVTHLTSDNMHIKKIQTMTSEDHSRIQDKVHNFFQLCGFQHSMDNKFQIKFQMPLDT